MNWIRVYHNGVPLCGSDFAINIKGLGIIAKQRRLTTLKSRVDSLSNTIKPYLLSGTLTYREE